MNMKDTTKMNTRYEAPKPDLLTRQAYHTERHPAIPHSKQTLTQVMSRMSETNTPVGTKETVDHDGRTLTVKRAANAILVTGFATHGTVRYRITEVSNAFGTYGHIEVGEEE